jgi:hypothetical protein
MKQAQKPKVKNLGTCVVERGGAGFLVMFADGSVRGFVSLVKAYEAISKFFARKTPSDSIGVGQITTYDGSTSAAVVRNGFVVKL